MRILLTGGAGFIGTHLARHLLDKGHTVGILDYRPDWRHVPTGPESYWFPLDCRDLPSWVNIKEWDFCYHLASTVGVQNVLADPRECIENIVESTRAVLGLGIPGIYFSSSEVYGKNREVLRENSDCILSPMARWSYAASKLAGEWLAQADGWKVVRLFNVIGPRQNPAYGAVVPKFIEAAKEGRQLPVHGDGQQVRTFTSVHDVVEILDRLRAQPFDVVNIGSENTIPIIELAYMVQSATGSWPGIQHIPYKRVFSDQFEECPARVPDLTKLRSLIGNLQFRSIESTLKEIINGKFQRHEADVQECRSDLSGLCR